MQLCNFAIYRTAVRGKSRDTFVKQVIYFFLNLITTKVQEIKYAPTKEPTQPSAQVQQKPAQDNVQPTQRETSIQKRNLLGSSIMTSQPIQKPQEKRHKFNSPPPQQPQQSAQAKQDQHQANSGPLAIQQTQVVQTTSKQTSGTANVIIK